jgi:hypothetical protein
MASQTVTTREDGRDIQYEKTVVTFAPGSAILSSDQVTRLRNAAHAANVRGDIKKTEVAVWSDRAHPVKGDLPKRDRDLAADRISAIKRAINPELGSFDFVTEFNMAENATWLGRMFNSTEAELDSAYAKEENLPIDRHDLNLIKEDGAPRKGIVIFRVKPDNK